MIDLVELVWPRLHGAKSEEELKSARRADYERLRSSDWSHDTDVVLEEARRLQDAELDRRKTLEGKAVAYLALVGVLIPLITTFGTNAWDSKLSAAQRFTGLIPLLASIAYLLAAGSWAFQALDIQASARVDGKSLARLWSRPRNAPAALINEILTCVRYDQDGVNAKGSAIRMTHAFLRRAAVAFTLLLAIQVMWKPATEIARIVTAIVQPKPAKPHLPEPKIEKAEPGTPVAPLSPMPPLNTKPETPSNPAANAQKPSSPPLTASKAGQQSGSAEKPSADKLPPAK